MKFHYVWLFVGSLVLALIVLWLSMSEEFDIGHQYAPIPPTSTKIEIQFQLMRVVDEASAIEKAVGSLEVESAETDTLKKVSRVHLHNIKASVETADKLIQSLAAPSSDTNPPSNTGFDWSKIGQTVATIIASIGTISSIILSWRKDLKEARSTVSPPSPPPSPVSRPPAA